MKFFPAEASGGRPYLSAVSGPCPHAAVLPDGWHHAGDGGRLAGAAQRRLRRRVVADAEGRCGARGLGPHRGAGRRGCRAAPA